MGEISKLLFKQNILMFFFTYVDAEVDGTESNLTLPTSTLLDFLKSQIQSKNQIKIDRGIIVF